jgi:prepilin peptidase CpaA
MLTPVVAREVGILIVVAFTGAAVVCDLRTREIPDWLSVVIACVGVGFMFFSAWPGGIWAGLAGCLIASAAGIAMFWSGGFGGGDAKLLSALGLVFGLKGVIVVLTVMAVAGGVLALIARARGQTTFAYGPAIGLGALAQAVLEWRAG